MEISNDALRGSWTGSVQRAGEGQIAALDGFSLSRMLYWLSEI